MPHNYRFDHRQWNAGVDAEQIRSFLATVDLAREFDPGTLQRAIGYLARDHLESLTLEHTRRGGTLLRALVRGSGGAIYEPWVEFRNLGKGRLSMLGSCDCPVEGACKHQAVALLYAQRHPADQWPQEEATVPTAPPPTLPANRLELLPGWLRDAMADQVATRNNSDLPAWEHWLAQLPQHMAPAAGQGIGERRFGVLLREEDGWLTALPAFLRPARGKSTGWVDPRPLDLTPHGPFPAPAEGWSPEDAMALATLLAAAGDTSRRTKGVLIDGPHLEVALEHLLHAHPVYWERGSVPLEPGPAKTMRLTWQANPDGSQTLRATLDEPDSGLLLRGHGLWYVQPDTRRYGRVAGEARTLDAIDAAPVLRPEDVSQVRKRLTHVGELPVDAPAPRTMQRIDAPPVPVLVMQAPELSWSGRATRHQPTRLGVAQLYFDYAGHRVAASDGPLPRLLANHGDVVEIHRDGKQEGEFVARMHAAGLHDAVGWSFLIVPNGLGVDDDSFVLRSDAKPVPAAPEDWAPVLATLGAAGFVIEYGPEFPRDDVVEVEDWHAEIDSSDEFGNPWFDVSLGIDVDGQRIDLLPILRRVLADPDFPLRKPDSEPADAAWRVRIDEQRSVRLPLERLRALLEPLLEWILASNEGLRLHRTQAETLRRVADGSGLPWRGADRLRGQLERLHDTPVSTIEPPGFRAELRPYQREGLAWLDFLADAGLGGVLADDMGLGKTVQVLAHLLSEKQRGRLDLPALVVAPTSLVGNWRDETARFAPDLRVLVLHGADRAARYEGIPEADVVITTYPLLPRDRDSLCEHRFSLLILDEAQAIKNARSQAAQVVREIPARRRLAMTGTPLENHLGELWAQFDAVEPGLLGSETSFTRLYRTPIEKHGDGERQARLGRRISLMLLRRRKEDVLTELPPKTEIVHSLELAGAQRQLYETLRLAQHERVRESIAQRGLGQSGIVVIDALLKLRQACCDPRLVKLDSARKVKESAKLEALLDLLSGLTSEGRRVLVFSQFAQMLALIGAALDKRRMAYLSLTGDTPSATRGDLVQRFQNGEVPIFLISLKAGGVGLNLTAADAVIHYDPWWNPAVESQATDRAYRIGQDKPVFVYKLICAGTVEEKIQAMQERKAELARAVLEGGSSTALRFDEVDLAELFAPI